jgi:membrane protein implicated in regulation of membrane protease activity
MWLVAGMLLGLVVLASLVGFHTGPHTHIAAGILGLVAAIWLVIMVTQGRSLSVLLALLGADLVVSAGVGLLAWKGLTGRTVPTLGSKIGRLEGAEGVAQSDLDPDGIVRVHGETWSASSLNGPVRAGTTVQVIRVDGVRLGVWGEETGTPTASRELRGGSA